MRSTSSTTYLIGSGVIPGLVVVGLTFGFTACRSPEGYRQQADQAAYANVHQAQQKALGHEETFTIERPADALRRKLLLDQNLKISAPASLGADQVERIPQWPDKTYDAAQPSPTNAAPLTVLTPSLLDALQIAARNSREYQDQKELVFVAGLKLDLERDTFSNTWTGRLEALFSHDKSGGTTTQGSEGHAKLGVGKKLKTGGAFALNLSVDLVKLLTMDKSSALGLLADATLSVPLLRGSDRFVVTEPLTQAQRDVVYAIYTFERFKRTFAVQMASQYLQVLQQLDQVKNAKENYRRLILATRRAQRLADAGQLPQIQVDQSRQDELSARNRWVSARTSYANSLDAFKFKLGLPPDAEVELDPKELDRLSQHNADLLAQVKKHNEEDNQSVLSATDPVTLREPSRKDGGPLEIQESVAMDLALSHRLDLRTQIGRVLDAQRKAAVAADQLRADLTLVGQASNGATRSLGSASKGDSHLGDGRYSATLGIDLPLERTAERNQYRGSLIDFEKSVRDVQQSEDQIKLDVRNDLRSLLESRESIAIQAGALDVAQRRLDSTTMFLEAGRAEIRDVLEAEASLLSAQNALSAAMVNYRVNELQLQRDMGVLEIDENGMWKEYTPAPEDNTK